MSRLRVDYVTKKQKNILNAIHIKNRFDLYNATIYLKKERLNVPINSWVVIHENGVLEIMDEIEFHDTYNLLNNNFIEIRRIS